MTTFNSYIPKKSTSKASVLSSNLMQGTPLTSPHLITSLNPSPKEPTLPHPDPYPYPYPYP
ncbi:hypothetical protein BO99DRAFT_403202 [Aspergillus violaceofuscus CBS 115571]|uniref:Uncharacterized protein n=1 Tax=Aspergillus violaceofuscus (strain CBS 115571) TaxID=1450538 RepID=A0A2V5IGR8_ASPV1|nr:hypothetical protein BO99DRAFT_403202 [Aspergillus violaceofuscus CBS 115571]